MIAHGTEPDRKELRGRWDDTSNGEPISACTFNCYEVIHIEGPTDESEYNLQYLAWLDLCAFVAAIARRVRKHLARLPGGKSAQVTKLGATGIAPRNRGPPAQIQAAPRKNKPSGAALFWVDMNSTQEQP